MIDELFKVFGILQRNNARSAAMGLDECTIPWQQRDLDAR